MYQAVTEEMTFFDDHGEAEATAWTIAYERTNCERTGRPVLFAYNGGPGAASAVGHLGALAPERVKMGDAVAMDIMPPFQMEANPDTIDVYKRQTLTKSTVKLLPYCRISSHRLASH